MVKVLDRVNEPKDLKGLTIEELNKLANEMRELIIKKVNAIGGHIGPNLGFVEPTIAIHRVFNSPKDKIVFDVSHQCYSHKILTGRKESFIEPEKYLKFSGYTNPEESEHDVFVVGHTSTSVSLATGLAKGRDLKGEKHNVIAIIGDGSLSGGEAFEGLDNASVLGSNIIIIVNDNEMSIAVNQGGLYSNLKELRDTKGKAECNFFKALGFEYFYVDDGNNVEDMIRTLEKVKDINHPVVVHIHTLKGKGLKVAEENKEAFHWILPGTLDKDKKSEMKEPVENYETVTTNYILEKFKKDKSIIAINPATPGAVGFSQEFRDILGKNYTDVGIAEEHATAYASGIACSGAKPVFAVLSSFIQRTYDQLSQDLALNNSPVTLLIFWGALTPADMTHLGAFDIPLISNIPNIVYLAPTCKEEYLKMLDWSVVQTSYPVAIRVPFGNFISSGIQDDTDYSVLNKFYMADEGSEVAIVALGSFFELGKKVKNELKNKLNINATLINPKFISGLDKELLSSLKSNHKLVITLEDGIVEGGFGQKIASFYGNSNMKVLNFGGAKEFTDRMPLEVIYDRNHLKPNLIVEDIKNSLY